MNEQLIYVNDVFVHRRSFLLPPCFLPNNAYGHVMGESSHRSVFNILKQQIKKYSPTSFSLHILKPEKTD